MKIESINYLQWNTKHISSSYDAVVIGMGIGGLSCANYLAKSGLKVLVVEKHYAPGGYCSSFRKKGYYFDAGAHYLGGCRRGGQIGRLIADHGLERRIRFIRANPSDVFVTKNREIKVWQDYECFIEELQRNFPNESIKIRNFMEYMTKTNPLQLYAELKEKTFAEVLDQYFSDTELKSIFSFPLGNVALPSTEASALTTIFLYREFIFDGGYYPEGGMQALPDILVKRFQEYGGEVLFLTPAQAILIRNGKVDGVRLKIGGKLLVEVKTPIVIANCDLHQLTNQLLCNHDQTQLNRFKYLLQRKPSVSAIMVHLGVRKELRGIAKYESNVWYYPGIHIDEYYAALTHGELALEKGFLFYSIPSMHDPTLLSEGRHSIQAIIGAPFMPRGEWEKDGLKTKIAKEVIYRIEHFIPDVSKWVEVELIATPPTLIKYTSNYEGAMYGWASISSQVGNHVMNDLFDLHGLFVVGHWSDVPTGHSGVTTVVASGRSIARLILRKQRLINV